MRDDQLRAQDTVEGDRLVGCLVLPRDHYVRLDSNEYSVHPAAVGRRVLVRADPDRATATCGGLVHSCQVFIRIEDFSMDPGRVTRALEGQCYAGTAELADGAVQARSSTR